MFRTPSWKIQLSKHSSDHYCATVCLSYELIFLKTRKTGLIYACEPDIIIKSGSRNQFNNKQTKYRIRTHFTGQTKRKKRKTVKYKYALLITPSHIIRSTVKWIMLIYCLKTHTITKIQLKQFLSLQIFNSGLSSYKTKT